MAGCAACSALTGSCAVSASAAGSLYDVPGVGSETFGSGFGSGFDSGFSFGSGSGSGFGFGFGFDSGFGAEVCGAWGALPRR